MIKRKEENISTLVLLTSYYHLSLALSLLFPLCFLFVFGHISNDLRCLVVKRDRLLLVRFRTNKNDIKRRQWAIKNVPFIARVIGRFISVHLIGDITKSSLDISSVGGNYPYLNGSKELGDTEIPKVTDLNDLITLQFDRKLHLPLFSNWSTLNPDIIIIIKADSHSRLPCFASLIGILFRVNPSFVLLDLIISN